MVLKKKMIKNLLFIILLRENREEDVECIFEKNKQSD